jgi:hypothetical protein
MSALGRGPSAEELRDEQKQQRLHQMNLDGARAQDPMDTAYINQMTDHNLSDPTVDILSNLLDEDFMLSNFAEAEVHEYRWLARVMVLEIEALHPSDDAVFTGELRAAVFDDEGDALTPLSKREKAIIEQFVMGVIARATRGRGGWQQEMFNKTIQASETREVNDDDGGFITS